MPSPSALVRAPAEGSGNAVLRRHPAFVARLVRCEPLPAALSDRARDLLGSILRESAVRAFEAAIPDPAAPDLWAGAVAIAAEGRVDFDPAPANGRLEALVEGAEDAVPAGSPIPERVLSLNRYLFDTCHLVSS